LGQIKQPQEVLLITAVFSSLDTAFDWTLCRAEETFGKIALRSPPFPFEQFTDYYTPSMGGRLPKEIWAFEKLIDPAVLPQIKCLTNQWEEEFALTNKAALDSALSRPLNIDPGYIDLGKLILASTKDHAHRIYLSQGIFAETTLIYTQKHWQALPWSYPDYQSGNCQTFLTQCRELLKRLRTG
jgi:hypothetical protein